MIFREPLDIITKPFNFAGTYNYYADTPGLYSYPPDPASPFGCCMAHRPLPPKYFVDYVAYIPFYLISRLIYFSWYQIGQYSLVYQRIVLKANNVMPKLQKRFSRNLLLLHDQGCMLSRQRHLI